MPDLAHTHPPSVSIVPDTQKLIHSPGRQGNTHVTNSQAVTYEMVRLVSCFAHAPTLNRSNPRHINQGRQPNLLPRGLARQKVFALAAHIQVPLFTQPISNRFQNKTPSDSPPSLNNTPTQIFTTISILSTCFFDQIGEKRPLHPNLSPFLSFPFTLEGHTQPYPSQLYFLAGTHIITRAVLWKIASVTHRQSFMKAELWDATLTLQNLSRSNAQGRKSLDPLGHRTRTYAAEARHHNNRTT